MIPKVFRNLYGESRRQLRRRRREREDSSMGRLIAREQARFFLPPSRLSRLFSRLPCHPFTFRIILPSLRLIRPPTTLSLPLSLHGGRRLINEDFHFSISSPRYPSIHQRVSYLRNSCREQFTICKEENKEQRKRK